LCTRREPKEVFFFEKKNQKTFARLVPRKRPQAHVRWQQRESKSFLVLFFKKEHFLMKDAEDQNFHAP